MSTIKEKEEYAAKDELLEWIKQRISLLEEELKMLKTLLAIVEQGYSEPEVNPSERVEDVKIGKKLIAKVFRGEGYVRAVPKFPTGMPSDIEEYLQAFVEEIQDKQAREGIEPDERASLIVRTKPDGSVAEIRIANLTTTLDLLKSKATLKYAIELLYQLYKARKDKTGSEEEG
ncbi:MAG: hypothetical protein GSR77_07750 [Desulfurococcales archaeon]|nr:hypothetical protein [Desulfurococcales archaeon]